MTQFSADWLPPAFAPLLFKLSRANDLSGQLFDTLMEMGQRELMELVTVERDGRSIVHLKNVVQPPPAVGLIFGDVINQLRSALDHAVLLLVEGERGASLSRAHSKLTAFPVCRTEKSFTDWCKGKQRSIPELEAGTSIASRLESLQPYHASQLDPQASVPGDDAGQQLFKTPVAADGTPLVEHHPLIGLAEWSNEDKHRRLNVAIVRSVYQGIMPDPQFHQGTPDYEWLPGSNELLPGTDLYSVPAGDTLVADVVAYPAIMRPETKLWRPIAPEINTYQRWVAEIALPYLLSGSWTATALPSDLATSETLDFAALMGSGSEGYAWRSPSHMEKVRAADRRYEERGRKFTEDYFKGLGAAPAG
jgi:hypothetical protein